MSDISELNEKATLSINSAMHFVNEDGYAKNVRNYVLISLAASVLMIAKAVVQIADYGLPKRNQGRIN